MRLSHADWALCSRTVQEVYAVAAAGLSPLGLLPALFRLVPADYLAHKEINLHEGRLGAHSFPERPKLHARLDRFMATLRSHPLFDLWHGGGTAPVKISDVATVRQLQKTPVYQEFYRFTRMRHQICFFAGEGAGTRTGVTFNRWSHDFTERDRSVLAFIAPHVAQVREFARKTAQATRSLEGLGEGFRAMNRAVLAVEADGRIRWQSGLAREWLAELYPGCTGPATQLPVCVQQALDRAVRTVLPRGISSSEFSLSSPMGYRLVAHWGRAGDGSCTLTLLRERTLLNAALAARHDLTGREAEILHWISEAKTNLEITGILGICHRTTEKHIEHLFAKLGVQSRVEAQRLAWELRRAG